MEYRITLKRDSNGTILVTFPDLPEAQTFGETDEEALLRAVDALATVFEAYMADRRPIPAPSAPTSKKARTVRVSAMTTAKLALYAALIEQKTTKYAVAKRLGWHVPQVDRLFDLKHHSRLDQIEQAAAALGKRVDVRVV